MHPHQPPQPPVVYVQQKGGRATAVGVWLIVLAVFGPFLLVVLCCAGLFWAGLIGGATSDEPDIRPSVTTTR